MEQATVNRRYRVGKRIGEGGMAIVYRGHDLLLNRDVAIKALRPDYAGNPTFRARFAREAQAAAGFTHPNIIEIYDVGEEAGIPYIVTEFVHGETLQEIIANEGPFAPEDVAALLEQVAAALDYAHEQGLVHRDIKPQNILVTLHGVVKVVDFGIAKGVADSDLTATGTGVGTAHYLSPEQASGLMATPASDIYSLGVVAFEMLTRTLPFPADSDVGIALRHVHDVPPRPSAINRTIPWQVDEIVLRALAKDPTQRFPTAGSFAEAMSAAAAGAAPASESAVAPSRPAASRSTRAPRDTLPPPMAAPRVGSRLGAPSPPLAERQAAPLPYARHGAGCSTWVVGIVGLGLLVALIWGGFRLSPRFAQVASNHPTMTPAPATTAATTSAPTRPATLPLLATTAPVVPAAGDTVAVPDLTGHSEPDAAAMVNDRGLLLADAGAVYSESVPAEAIAEQDPPAGQQVARGTTIYVKRSLGSPRINIAGLHLVGVPADQAEQTLQSKGLSVQVTPVAGTTVPAGQVVAVEPAQSAMVGDTVTVQVSTGNTPPTATGG